MLLFIFESLGTSELIFVAIVALIFLGPRRLPEIARKMGRLMADLRGTANEFKQTWEREVDFEEETKALSIDLLDEEAEAEPSMQPAVSAGVESEPLVSPQIKEIDRDRFDALAAEEGEPVNVTPDEHNEEHNEAFSGPDLLSDKRNWL